MEWLNYHHLRYFWTVAKEGSLRKASEKLRVSQPAISVQVHRLEESLGERLFQRKGRQLVLTRTGQFALGYADEIFSLGGELITGIRHHVQSGRHALRLAVGVEDSFPKLLSYQILQPALGMTPPVQLVCREGKAEDLLAQLGLHRLDAILADEPATGAVKSEVFSHLLGRSNVAFCAARRLARRLRAGFPRSLHQAPALLPTPNTTLRRSLDEWFHASGIQPRTVAEFEDGALMKIAASDGQGFIAVPAVTISECVNQFRLEKIGQADACSDEYYLITGERRVTHPVVRCITEHARSLVFS